jgi:hypothetical protein
MRAVFLTRRRTTILWCRIRRPHIIAWLTSPINRGILTRHWAFHVVPVVLWAIHVMPIVLRTSNFAVHFAIIHAAVEPIVHTPVNTIIDATVGYWPGCNGIVSAEFSGA